MKSVRLMVYEPEPSFEKLTYAVQPFAAVVAAPAGLPITSGVPIRNPAVVQLGPMPAVYPGHAGDVAALTMTWSSAWVRLPIWEHLAKAC